MHDVLLMRNFSFSLNLGSSNLTIEADLLELRNITIFLGPNSSGKSITSRIIAEILDSREKFVRTSSGILKKRSFIISQDCMGSCIISSKNISIELRLDKNEIYPNFINLGNEIYSKESINTMISNLFAYPNLSEISSKLSSIMEHLNNILHRSIILSLDRVCIIHGTHRIDKAELPVFLSIKELLDLSQTYADSIPYIYEEFLKFVTNECLRYIEYTYDVKDVDIQDIVPIIFRIELPWLKNSELLFDYLSWSLLNYSSTDKPYNTLAKFIGIESLKYAPGGVSGAFILELLIRAYLAARVEPVLLIIEEPELNLHPLQAFALGAAMSWIVNKNVEETANNRAKPLRIIVTTHSPDIVRGCNYYPTYTSIHIFRRREFRIKLQNFDNIEHRSNEALIKYIIKYIKTRIS